MQKKIYLIPNEKMRYETSSHCFYSEGRDSYCLIQNLSDVLPETGWYELEINIHSTSSRGCASIQFDCLDNQYNQNQVIIHFESGTPTKRLFEFRSPSSSVRFVPSDTKAVVRIIHLSITEIKKELAIERVKSYCESMIGADVDLTCFKMETLYAIYDDFFRKNQVPKLDCFIEKKRINRKKSFEERRSEWFEIMRPTEHEIASQRRISKTWKSPPSISLIVPCYNSKTEWLLQLIDGIRQQSYELWECILIDDGSSRKDHIDAALAQVSSDRRFRVLSLNQNIGVSATCAQGVDIATGDYVAIVDHDDYILPNALYEMASVIRKKMPAVAYSDELLMDENGFLKHIEFRAAFNYRHLLSHPCIIHLTLIRRDVLLAAGNFNPNLAISQDYDLFLRIAAMTHDFVHVPKTLYCWRQHDESTGRLLKQHVVKTSKGALSRHLEAAGFKRSQAWVTSGLEFNTFRIRSKIPACKITVIIPTKDRIDLLKKCLVTLLGITELPKNVTMEVVIVDNGSLQKRSVEYFSKLAESGHTVIRAPGPFNFSVLNNIAAKETTGDFLLFLNNDTEISDADWLTAMLEPMMWKDVGVVGAKLLYPDSGKIQHAGVIIGMRDVADHDHQFCAERNGSNYANGFGQRLTSIRDCLAVTAACMLVRREAFNQVRGYDPQLAVGFGDTDLCLRLGKKGWKCVFTPYARLIHHESASRVVGTKDPHPEDTALFRKRWAKLIKQGDPYYNPNLSRYLPFFPALPDDSSP